MKTNVYVDAFNLYYGCLKDTPYKWLDLAAFCRVMLPNNVINRIRYFTAPVQSRPYDPLKPQRQQAYLRALQTIPNLSIHYGSYQTRLVQLPLVDPPLAGPKFARVWRTDEKGSDVNLAIYLLADGWENDYEVAVIVSNDSDLSEAAKMVRDKLDRRVGFLLPVSNPDRRVSKELLQVATFIKEIRKSTLRRSQFLPTLSDTQGTIIRPVGW